MRRPSLLVQLVLLFLLALFSLLGVVGYAYYQSSSHVIQQIVEDKSRNSVAQSSRFIQSYIKKLEETSTSLSRNSLVLAYATSGDSNQGGAVRELFDTVLKTDPDLIAAVLVTKSGHVISTDEHISMRTSSDMMNEDWYMKAIHQGAMPVLTPARKEVQNRNWVISVTQELVDQAGQNLGVLRLDIGYDTLATYLDQLQLGQEGFAFIINQQHAFVYHPKNSVYSSPSEMKAMKPYIDTLNTYSQDGQYYVRQEQVAGTDWTLIGVSSLEQLQALQRQILLTLAGTGLLGLLLGCWGIWYGLRRWMKPLKDLQATMLAVGNGQGQLRAKEVGTPELIDLSHQFNLMLDQIQVLMEEVRQKEASARHYELQALSSQINPHFLYNTLDTIVWMAEFHETKRLVQVTKSLARYFRLALNQGKELIRLADEVEHVRQYLFIQHQRYGDKLSYEIKEEPAVADFLIPKLVLQPLVENAIYHGIKEKRGPGKIELRIKKRPHGFDILIQDDGIGFAVEESSHQTLLKVGGVGLNNVDQRLNLQFGSSYRMDIASTRGQGTRVNLYFDLEG